MGYKNKYITTNCKDCGNIIQVLSDNFFRTCNKNKGFRCKECQLKFLSKATKARLANMTKEENDSWRTNLSKAQKKRWDNASDELRKIYAERLRKANIERWKNMTSEEKEAYGKRMSKINIDYWNSLSDEEKLNYSNKQKIAWNNLPEETKARLIHNIRSYHENLSESEREILYNKLRDGNKKWWNNLTDEQRSKISIERSNRMKKFWDNISEEKLEELKMNMSICMKQYWKNLTNEDIEILHIKKSEAAKKAWKNMSNETRELMSNIRRINKIEWWNNLSFNKKREVLAKISESVHNWWNNMSDEEYSKWKKSYIDSRVNMGNDAINKNESDFIEHLHLISWTNNKLSYISHWYNKIIPENFDKLFPINPVTNSDIVIPIHEWDLKIENNGKIILVDIDGSIHNIEDGGFVVDNVDIGKNTRFNDSKRIYQTDGYDAYIVQCYDDNLTLNTPVVKLNTSETIVVWQLLELFK